MCMRMHKVSTRGEGGWRRFENTMRTVFVLICLYSCCLSLPWGDKLDKETACMRQVWVKDNVGEGSGSGACENGQRESYFPYASENDSVCLSPSQSVYPLKHEQTRCFVVEPGGTACTAWVTLSVSQTKILPSLICIRKLRNVVSYMYENVWQNCQWLGLNTYFSPQCGKGEGNLFSPPPHLHYHASASCNGRPRTCASACPRRRSRRCRRCSRQRPQHLRAAVRRLLYINTVSDGSCYRWVYNVEMPGVRGTASHELRTRRVYGFVRTTGQQPPKDELTNFWEPFVVRFPSLSVFLTSNFMSPLVFVLSVNL